MNLYFRNTGNSWADPNNWSDTDGGAAAGVIPTIADDVFLTASSGNISQDTGTPQTIKNLSTIGYTGTITLLNTLIITDTLTRGNNNATWAGGFGFITNNLNNIDTSGSTITYQAGNTYIVQGSYISTGNSGAVHGKVVSSVPGTKAKFTVMGEETIAYIDYTDIDASGGRPIYTFNGVVTNCININSMVEPVAPPNRTVASSSII